MNSAQQCHSTAFFIESHDCNIQLTLSSANNLQCLLGGLCDEENRAGVPERLPYNRFEVFVARVEKNEPCESWMSGWCQSGFHCRVHANFYGNWRAKVPNNLGLPTFTNSETFLAESPVFGELASASSVEQVRNDKKTLDQTHAENRADLFRVHMLRGRGLTEEISGNSKDFRTR